MFDYYNDLWNEYGFEIVVFTCILFIIIYGIYRKTTGHKGSWYSERQYYNYLGQAITQNDNTKEPVSFSYAYSEINHLIVKVKENVEECYNRYTIDHLIKQDLPSYKTR